MTGADQDSAASPGGGLIFVSDASAEAERLTVALRSRGYPTVDVPLGLLSARVSVQRPALILCDADAPGVLEVVATVCHGPAAPPSVVFLGAPDGILDNAPDRVQAHARAVFRRPVEVYALLRKVEALIGAPPEEPMNGSLAAPSRTPVLVAAARKPYMVDASHHDRRSVPPRPSPRLSAPPPPPTPPPPTLNWQRPASPQSAQLSLLPDEPVHLNQDIPHSHISPELAALLHEAEQRLEAQPLRDLQRQRLSPEAEIDAVLPPDVLASLDEPLDDDDDFEQDVGHGTKSGSEGGGTAPGSHRGASALVEVDDPQSRATNPGGAAPPFDEESESAAHVGGEARATEPPPPTPTVAPPTPAARSLSVPALTAVGGGTLAETGRPPASEWARSSEARAAFDARTQAREHSAAQLGPPPTSRPPRLRGAEPAPEPEPHATPETDSGDAPSTNGGGPPHAADPPKTSDASGADPASTASAAGRKFSKVLSEGVARACLAQVIRERLTGALVFEDGRGIRRVVFRDGDFVTASTSAEEESLVQFLAQRGDLSPDAALQLAKRLPPFGRHAGAALIANGHLKQNELWSVLRAHAEWLISRLVQQQTGQLDWEAEVPDRLRSEPAVFGGSTGAEVFVETVKRVVSPAEARAQLGGATATLGHGQHFNLLGECALTSGELDLVRRAPALTLDEAQRGGAAADFAAVCLALVELGVLGRATMAERAPALVNEREDPLDDHALRARVTARFALVEEGDYFEVLGVSRTATDYEIRKAHETLKRDLTPARVLTARNADLRDKLDAILMVLDEAFEVLGDSLRRERYRRAIEALPT
ncbi:MAG TPA: DUF4388 domain-containing protein [Polyangiaceae bacterium]|nr:DUF4388 domain-containing protein [Polyangiaceae bacterium]